MPVKPLPVSGFGFSQLKRVAIRVVPVTLLVPGYEVFEQLAFTLNEFVKFIHDINLYCMLWRLPWF